MYQKFLFIGLGGSGGKTLRLYIWTLMRYRTAKNPAVGRRMPGGNKALASNLGELLRKKAGF